MWCCSLVSRNIEIWASRVELCWVMLCSNVGASLEQVIGCAGWGFSNQLSVLSDVKLLLYFCVCTTNSREWIYMRVPIWQADKISRGRRVKNVGLMETKRRSAVLEHSLLVNAAGKCTLNVRLSGPWSSQFVFRRSSPNPRFLRSSTAKWATAQLLHYCSEQMLKGRRCCSEHSAGSTSPTAVIFPPTEQMQWFTASVDASWQQKPFLMASVSTGTDELLVNMV